MPQLGYLGRPVELRNVLPTEQVFVRATVHACQRATHHMSHVAAPCIHPVLMPQMYAAPHLPHLPRSQAVVFCACMFFQLFVIVRWVSHKHTLYRRGCRYRKTYGLWCGFNEPAGWVHEGG